MWKVEIIDKLFKWNLKAKEKELSIVSETSYWKNSLAVAHSQTHVL